MTALDEMIPKSFEIPSFVGMTVLAWKLLAESLKIQMDRIIESAHRP